MRDKPPRDVNPLFTHSGYRYPFTPKFGADGLLTAVVTDAADGAVLMVAHMDAEALRATRETGLAHFHSRSRGRLWMKGETSGHTLRVVEIRVDCDQDAIVLKVEQLGGGCCHTKAPTCFYRKVDLGKLSDGLVPLVHD